MSKAAIGRVLSIVAPLLASFLLAGCFMQEFFVERGVFLGELVGFVELDEGTVLGLHLATQRETLEAQRITFTGTATLGGVEYRVEGEEWTDDERLTYQALPDPTGLVEASLFGEEPDAQYVISAHVFYGCTIQRPCDPVIHGTLSQGGERVGSVHLNTAE